MAFDILNRAYTIGTVDGAQDITPGVAQTGFRDFSTMPDSDTTYVVAVQGALWAYMTALKVGAVLRPQTYHDGSSGEGNSVTFSAGVITVFADLGWQHVVYNDANGVAQNAEGVLKSFSPETLVDLKTTTPIPASGKTVAYLRGILAGDKKGALYVWEPAEATAGDDFNYVVSALSATGRWVRQKQMIEIGSVASDGDAYNGATYKIGDEIRDKSSTGVVKKLPRVENVAIQATYATYAAFKAAASSKWVQGDLIELRGVTSEGDIDAPLRGVWEASSTNTTDLDYLYLRPDDISGTNPGRLRFPAPVRQITFTNSDATPSVAAGQVFKVAATPPAAITGFDGMRDGQRIIVYPNSADQVFTHGVSFVMPNGTDFRLRSGDSPIEFVKENSVITMIGGIVRNDMVVDPRDYGVTFDGTTNDTAAWGAVRDFVDGQGGGYVIQCPPGITVLDGIVFRSGNLIRGVPHGSDDASGNIPDPTRGTVFQFRAAATPGPVITFDSETAAGAGAIQPYGGGVEGITIDGVNVATKGLVALSCRYILIDALIERCTTVGCELNSNGSNKMLNDQNYIRRLHVRIGANAACAGCDGLIIAGDGYSTTANTFAASAIFGDDVLIEYQDGDAVVIRAVDTCNIQRVKTVIRSGGTGRTIVFASATQTFTSFSIGSIADNGNGFARYTATAHGLPSSGCMVKITSSSGGAYDGSTSGAYDDIGFATYVDANTFDMLSQTYTATSTATGGRIFSAEKNVIHHIGRGGAAVDKGSFNYAGVINSEGSSIGAAANGMGVLHTDAIIDRLDGARYRTVPFDLSGQIDMRITSAKLTTATLGELNGTTYISMADSVTSTAVCGGVRLPYQYNYGHLEELELWWMVNNSGSQSGNVKLDIEVRSRGWGQAAGASAESLSTFGDALTYLVAANNVTTTAIFRTVIPLEVNVVTPIRNMIFLEIARDGGHANDTYPNTFHIIHAGLNYVARGPREGTWNLPLRFYE